MICPRCSVGEISEATQECLVCGFSRTGGVVVETSSEWNRVEDPLLPALERQFSVEGVLRRGATSRVYLARDQVTGRLCSLKVLPLGADVPDGLIERFRKDALRAATLDHPHLVSLLSYGATDEAVWYAMEYVQGRSLGDLLRSADRMDLKTCLRLVEQIASALDYGHRRGLTHGNLKPANVLVDPEGWARVADLGVSAAFGTLPRRAPEQSIEENYGHTAPEQFGTEGQLSPAADQYALAVLAFYCLARRPPVVGETLEEITRNHLEGSAPLIAESRPDLPAYVSSSLARAMRRAPADRFPGVLDFVSALSGVALPEPAGTPVVAATAGETTGDEATGDEAKGDEATGVEATAGEATAGEPTEAEATVETAADSAADAQPTQPEPVSSVAESAAVASTAAESAAAASSAAASSAAESAAVESTAASSAVAASTAVESAAAESAVAASTAATQGPTAEPPGPPLLLMHDAHSRQDLEDEEEEDADAATQEKEPVLLWGDRDHEAALAAAAAVAAGTAEQQTPAVASERWLDRTWSQVRPQLQRVADESRRLAGRWRALPRNVRYGSSAGVAILALAIVWWRVAMAGRNEPPRAPIYEPAPPTIAGTTPPPANPENPSGTTRHTTSGGPRNSTPSGATTPRDSGARRPNTGRRNAPEPAHLVINSTPWGVLYIDDRPYGNLPQAGLQDVPPGSHTIRILRDGYVPYERPIVIESGETLRLTDIMLVEKPQ